jgi:hypothetical protein
VADVAAASFESVTTSGLDAGFARQPLAVDAAIFQSGAPLPPPVVFIVIDGRVASAAAILAGPAPGEF